MSGSTSNSFAASGQFWLKALILAALILISGYFIILMYANGEYPFALLTLLVVALGIYVFTNPKTYAHRYIFPGVAGMVIFIIFPLIYTIGISFTNYSGANLLSLDRVQEYLLKQTFMTEGGSYSFSLIKADDNQYQIVLSRNTEQGKHYLVSAPLSLEKQSQIAAEDDQDISLPNSEQPVVLNAVADAPAQKPETIRTIVQLRTNLQALKLVTPDNVTLVMNGLRKFSAMESLYSRMTQGTTLDDGTIITDSNLFRNNRTGTFLLPNYKTGFYQPIDDHGAFVGDKIPPGFSVGVGWKNYIQALTDEGIQGPFLQIFVWTVIFAGGSVLFTLVIGMILANLVQWDELRGRSAYRLLLILPYAVPAFISILVFKGLFNQNFGEINLALDSLFGVQPSWFTDPVLAKVMILFVNTWLGYPYMMILCMGLLKSIPEDLYEASAMDGSGPFGNFIKITVPLLMKPLTPLLIASFAFNFNNFVLIFLLTKGQPDIIGATTPAGHTDILVSYTYRIAFEGSGQNYGLASAIATLIFILVGALALFNLKLMKTNNA